MLFSLVGILLNSVRMLFLNMFHPLSRHYTLLLRRVSFTVLCIDIKTASLVNLVVVDVKLRSSRACERQYRHECSIFLCKLFIPFDVHTFNFLSISFCGTCVSNVLLRSFDAFFFHYVACVDWWYKCLTIYSLHSGFATLCGASLFTIIPLTFKVIT